MNFGVILLSWFVIFTINGWSVPSFPRNRSRLHFSLLCSPLWNLSFIGFYAGGRVWLGKDLSHEVIVLKLVIFRYL